MLRGDMNAILSLLDLLGGAGCSCLCKGFQ